MNRSLYPPGSVAQMAERLLAGVAELRRAEAILNTPRAVIHPGLRDDDPRFVRELACILKAQIAERTGDYLDLEGVALPLARVIRTYVESYIGGGLR